MQKYRAQKKTGIQIVKTYEAPQLVMDSREVAKIIGKDHKNLLRDIRNYAEVLEESSSLSSRQFFTPSSYTNTQKKEQPNYLLTKMGCELVGNKMTGSKGVLFTATFVSRFNEMEKFIQQENNELVERSLNESLELHLLAVKHTAEMLNADKTTLLRMIRDVHEYYGIPTNHLVVHTSNEVN